MAKLGITAQRVLLLLLGGLALGLSGSPRRHARILKGIGEEWKQLDRRSLREAINRLYETKLLRKTFHTDGSIELVLNERGRKAALRYTLNDMVIKKPSHWDHKWRLILFDIPEKHKKLRDTLRMRLRQFGLIEFQKSVFVHPYECRNEIDFLIELYDARRYVRFIEAAKIDNEFHLKKKFKI